MCVIVFLCVCVCVSECDSECECVFVSESDGLPEDPDFRQLCTSATNYDKRIRNFDKKRMSNMVGPPPKYSSPPELFPFL